MPQQITDTFTIVIKGKPNDYTIEASGPNSIRVDPQPFELRISHLPTTFADLTNENVQISPNSIKELGQALYRSLFLPQIATAYGRAQQSLKRSDSLRLGLYIEPPELAALPWEAMHDGQNWLATRTDSPLVRILPELPDEKSPLQKLQIRGALRILFVGASPEDLPGLKIGETAAQLQKLLQESIDNKRIVFDIVLNATLDDLRQHLRQEYHIIYFAGHSTPKGIYFDDGQGDVDPKTNNRLPGDPDLVSARTLARGLEGKAIRLVFLSACDTGRTGQDSGLLAGFAQQLARLALLPGIIAMQSPISDMQAGQLAAHFFDAVAKFQPVDVALAEARKTLIRQEQFGRDAIAPVIYLQAKDSALFQRARNWIAIGATVFAIFVLMVLIAQTLFFQPDRRDIAAAEKKAAAESYRADLEEKTALSRELAAKSLEQLESGLDPEIAILVAIEAVRTTNRNEISSVSEAENALRRTLQTPLIATLRHDHVRDLVFSPDGRYLYTVGGGLDYGVLKWEVSTSKSIVELGNEWGSYLTDISADGQYLAVINNNRILVMDTINNSEVTKINLGITVAGDEGCSSPKFNFSHTGSRIVTISNCSKRNPKGLVQLWDTISGKELITVTENRSEILDIALSPDGTKLVTGNRYDAEIWDVNSGDRLKRLDHDGEVWKITFSPDGSRIITAGHDKQGEKSTIEVWDHKSTAKVWDAISGQLLHTLPHQGSVETVAVSPDGIWLATGGNDHSAHLWNLRTGEKVFSVTFDGPVDEVTFSDDGSKLALRGWNSNIAMLVDVSTGRELARLGHRDLVRSFSFSPVDNLLATVSDDGYARIWSTDNFIEPKTIHRQESAYSYTVSPDGEMFATGADDGTVMLWDFEHGRHLSTIQFGNTWIQSIIFSEVDDRLVVLSDGKIYIWDLLANEKILEIENCGKFHLAINDDASLVAADTVDNGICVWDVPNAEKVAQILDVSLFSPTNSKILFNQDGTRLVAHNTKNAWMWDIRAGDLLSQVEFQGEISTVFFDDTFSSLVIAAKADGVEEAKILDGITGNAVTSFEPSSFLSGAIPPMMFHPKLDLLVSVSNRVESVGDKIHPYIIVLNTKNGNIEDWYYLDHDGHIATLDLSPDGRQLVTASDDGTVRIWGFNNHDQIAKFNFDNQAREVKYSPNGDYVATANNDGSVYLIKTTDWQEIAKLPDATGQLIFDNDGSRLLTDHYSKLWTVRIEDLLEKACQAVNRDLTQEEWEAYVGVDIPYQTTCTDVKGTDPPIQSENAPSVLPSPTPTSVWATQKCPPSNFCEYIVDDTLNRPTSVYTADLDNDGDVDLLGADLKLNLVAWWENNETNEFTRHPISENFEGVQEVYAIDVDSDGDMDVLGVSGYVSRPQNTGRIAWWENDGSQNFTEHIITSDFDYANDIFAIDLDGDSDVDIVGASGDNVWGQIAWWENDGSGNFAQHYIDSQFYHATSVYAIDLDDDEDVDVVGASYYLNEITWWENDGNQDFAKHVIDNSFTLPNTVSAADLDRDGDIDILGSADAADQTIRWWENNGNQNFTKHNTDDVAHYIQAIDIDGDEDVDLLGTNEWAGELFLLENDGNQNFKKQLIATGSGNPPRGINVNTVDLEGDGDIDILGVSGGSGISSSPGAIKLWKKE